MLKPIQDIIIIEQERETESKGGIVLPETAEQKITQGKVIRIGPDVEEIAVGDTVYHNAWNGYEFEDDGKRYIAMREDDVEAVDIT